MGLRGVTVALVCVVWLMGLPLATSAEDRTPPAPGKPGQGRAGVAPAQTGLGEYQKLVAQYCATCHSDRQKAAGLSLQGVDLGHLSAHRDTWEKVVRKVSAGAMPPSGAPRPDPSSLDGMAKWLATTLDREAAARPNPGRPALHRLNRAEYANAIRDVLSLEVDVSTLLFPLGPGPGPAPE